MPTLSTFHGISVAMRFRAHAPPHVHARHAEHEAAVRLDGVMLAGTLPPRAAALVRQWLALHEDELVDNWRRARQGVTLVAVAPLP